MIQFLRICNIGSTPSSTWAHSQTYNRFVSLRNMQFTIHRGVRKVTTKNFQFLETSEDNVESAAEDTEDSEDGADEEDLSFEDNEGKKFS